MAVAPECVSLEPVEMVSVDQAQGLILQGSYLLLVYKQEVHLRSDLPMQSDQRLHVFLHSHCHLFYFLHCCLPLAKEIESQVVDLREGNMETMLQALAGLLEPVGWVTVGTSQSEFEGKTPVRCQLDLALRQGCEMDFLST